MSIYFGRKKTIKAVSTKAPLHAIEVQAYPVILHFQFPIKLAVYRNPYYYRRWTCCELSTGRHIGRYLHTRKATIESAVAAVRKYIAEHNGDENCLSERIKENEILNGPTNPERSTDAAA